MSIVQTIDRWSDKQTIKWLLLLRVAFGLMLLFKGFSFISHTQELEALIANSRFKDETRVLAQYVTFSHLFGGTMIIIGLLTRVAALIQIPVLIGAIFFVHAGNGLMSIDSQLGVSILALVLLIFFLIEGGGPYSIDRYIRRKHL